MLKFNVQREPGESFSSWAERCVDDIRQQRGLKPVDWVKARAYRKPTKWNQYRVAKPSKPKPRAKRKAR